MFAEVKRALPISGDSYDAQIIDEIEAAALDLTKTAEIALPGTISITIGTGGVITDTSTVTDKLVIAAISTWCALRIGNPPNYDNLLSAYERLKGQLRLSSYYSTYEPVSE